MQVREKDKAEVINFISEFNQHLQKKNNQMDENNKIIAQQQIKIKLLKEQILSVNNKKEEFKRQLKDSVKANKTLNDKLIMAEDQQAFYEEQIQL